MVHLPLPLNVHVIVPSAPSSADHVPANASLLPQAESVRSVTTIRSNATNFFIILSFFLSLSFDGYLSSYRATAIFTTAVHVRCGRCAAVGTGDCRFGCGLLFNLLAHILADLRQNLPDLQLRYSTLVSGLHRVVIPGRIAGGGVISTESELILKRISSK